MDAILAELSADLASVFADNGRFRQARETYGLSFNQAWVLVWAGADAMQAMRPRQPRLAPIRI